MTYRDLQKALATLREIEREMTFAQHLLGQARSEKREREAYQLIETLERDLDQEIE